MNKIRDRRGSRAMAVVPALVLAAAILLPMRAGGQPPQAEAEPTELAKELVGAWVLEKAETPGSPSGVGSRLKFFTGTHWMISQPDPKTGKVVFHHGGRYTLDGDTLTETVEFANESTVALVGQSNRFKLRVTGDTLEQAGQRNPFTETWKRAKPE